MKLSRERNDDFVESTLFKSLVSSLRYLTIIRPDIVYEVRLVNHYMEILEESHWLAAKRNLRYIQGVGPKAHHSSFDDD